MKHTTYLLKAAMIGISVVMLAGCSGSELKQSESQTQEAGSEAAKPAENTNTVPAEFEALGISIKAPAGAEEVTASVVEESVAEIKFKLNGNSFTYKAVKGTLKIDSYGEFDSAAMLLQADKDSGSPDLEIRTIVSGGRLALWKIGETSYSLYTADEMKDDTIADITIMIAGELK